MSIGPSHDCVRRGAKNWGAGPDEIREIAQPRQSNDQATLGQWE